MHSSTPSTVVVAVPGTVVLVDPAHSLGRRRAKNDSDVVLVPTPSSDPEDPLNWAPRRKLLALTCVLLYVLAVAVQGAVVTAIVVPFSIASTISIPDIIAGNGYSYLLAGWSLLFWQPFALQYGKRLTYLTTFGALAIINVWRAYCRTNGQWIGNNILAGFFVATVEALPENTIVDLFFTHERGTYMSFYALSLIGGSTIGPIIAGFITDAIGYRWVFFIPSIFCGCIWIFLFLFMEETNYSRRTSQLSQSIEAADADLGATEAQTDVKDSKDSKAEDNPDDIQITRATTHSPKTFWQKMSLKPHQRKGNFWAIAKTQVRFCTWPVVLFSGFAYGLNLVWTVVVGFTSSTILSAPPYNFRPSMVGLTNIAGLIGIFASVLVSGTLNDWITLRLVRANNGIFEPEMRLWLFTLSLLLIPASIILWGVGAAHQIAWIGLMFAIGFLAFANTTTVPLSVNYVIDTYRDMSGSALTIVIIIRNTMYFAISYGISPWIANMGLQNAYISCAFIALACTSSFLIMIKWGKQIRQRSAVQYWALLQDCLDKGIVH